MDNVTLELMCLVWQSRSTGRQWRTRPMPRAMAEAWLRTAQETGRPGLTQWLEPFGHVWGWTEGRGREALPPGWSVRQAV
jgi:hypothetical protein